MNEITRIESLVETLCEAHTIDDADVLRLRRSVYADGVCSAAEAESVFRLDQACNDKVPAWSEFYVDSLTDFFVWQADPRGYIDAAQADMLIARISQDGRIDSQSELELLINVINRAEHCPEKLVVFALDTVRRAILEPETAPYGSNRPPALITAADAAIIRKLITAPAGDGSITVTRREAELVMDLNDATRGQDNAPEWRDLFVRSIANYLMFPREAPVTPSADEEKRREAWLADRRGIGNLLAGVGRAFAHGDLPFAEAWHAIDPFGVQRAREEAAAEHRQVREALRRESIDAEEAAWLIGHLKRSGGPDENQRALLAFIREHSPRINPTLDAYMRNAGI